MCSKFLLVLCALLALQLTAFAHPVENDKDVEESGIIKPGNDEGIIPNTPGVQQFKKDLVNHLLKAVVNEEEDESGVYSAQQASSEIDLPCTNDTVRVVLISSSFPVPERFFHTPKRCSEEVN